MGDLSAHFDAREFRCRCGRVETVSAQLLLVLERMRRLAGGRPLTIVSGWRCARHNALAGGIRTSQHLWGRAADVPGGYGTIDQWREAGAVGIGVRRGRVIHVDVTPGRTSFVFDD